MSHSSPLRLALVSVLALAIAGPVAAQSVSVTFSNTDLPPIPLLDNSSVSIDANGNLTAQCVPNGNSCAGISSGSGGNAPVVSLTRNNGTGVIAPGSQIGLTWTVTNNAELCLATSSPAVTGWNNSLVSAAGGSQSLTLSTSAEYTFGLKCYGAGGSSDLATVAATVQGGGDPPPPATGIPACETPGIAGDPNVQPAGFTGHRLSWGELFYGATFPHFNSHLSPVGSYTLRAMQPSTRGPTMNARYLTTSFVAAPNTNYKIGWVGAQAIPAVSYMNPRAADAVFVSISPCAGDLRPRVVSNPGPFLGSTCRALVSNGNLFYGTTGGAGQCSLVAGQTYFINIAMVNPSNLNTTTTTCASSMGNRCEANFDGF